MILSFLRTRAFAALLVIMAAFDLCAADYTLSADSWVGRESNYSLNGVVYDNWTDCYKAIENIQVKNGDFLVIDFRSEKEARGNKVFSQSNMFLNWVRSGGKIRYIIAGKAFTTYTLTWADFMDGKNYVRDGSKWTFILDREIKGTAKQLLGAIKEMKIPEASVLLVLSPHAMHRTAPIYYPKEMSDIDEYFDMSDGIANLGDGYFGHEKFRSSDAWKSQNQGFRFKQLADAVDQGLTKSVETAGTPSPARRPNILERNNNNTLRRDFPEIIGAIGHGYRQVKGVHVGLSASFQFAGAERGQGISVMIFLAGSDAEGRQILKKRLGLRDRTLPRLGFEIGDESVAYYYPQYDRAYGIGWRRGTTVITVISNGCLTREEFTERIKQFEHDLGTTQIADLLSAAFGIEASDQVIIRQEDANQVDVGQIVSKLENSETQDIERVKLLVKLIPNPSEEAKETLIKHATERSYPDAVRANAMRALVALGNEDCIKVLEKCFLEPDSSVTLRSQALRCIAKLRRAEAVEFLRGVSNDADESEIVKARAEGLLLQMERQRQLDAGLN